MPNTQIAGLPYPAPTDPPNGPNQFLQLANAVEKRLVNFYSNNDDRHRKLGAPTRGQLSWRDDDQVFEYWNGSAWIGIDRTVAIVQRGAVSDATDRAFTTTQSGAHAKSTVTLENKSKIYRMFWFTIADFSVSYTWDKPGQNAEIRHYMQFGSATAVGRGWGTYTSDGTGRTFSGMYPARSGVLGVNSKITISTWLTIRKANTVAGKITFIGGSTDFSAIGIQSV